MAQPITSENRSMFLEFIGKALDSEGAEISLSQVRPTIPHPETGAPMPGPETITVVSLRYVTKHSLFPQPESL